MKQLNSNHRTKAGVLAAFAFIVLLCSFGGNDIAERFKNAALDLDKTSHTLVDEYDYWPECGIRVTGSHLASLISLNELQQMLPCPLYVSGPHHDGQWDLDNEEDFGHYNPEAIQYLANLAQKVVADKKFVELSKPLIDRYLYRQMHIMMVIHDALYDGTYSQEEREGIFNTSVETKGLEYDDYDVGFYLNRLKLDDDSYVFSNISYRFLHFWARRWVDGTIDPFYQGLSTIFMAYYPEYEYSAERYLIPSEEWFEEGGYEEEDVYVVIDGSELRLRLEPSTSADTFKWGDGSNRHPKVGERFLYLGEDGDFYLIDFHGHALWVSKKFTHLE
jgi:hypothetical protein